MLFKTGDTAPQSVFNNVYVVRYDGASDET
jgi:hypothetical protein